MDSLKINPYKSELLWLSVLIAMGLAIYFQGINIPYYGDDFQFVFENSSHHPFYYYFFNNIAENNFYRPIQATFLSLVQTHFGLNTIPLHLMNIALHVLLSWLVFMVMLGLGFPISHAILASLFMLASEANAFALLSNDTFSQITGTLFGCLSLWLFYLAFYQSRLQNSRKGLYRDIRYLLALLALTISYFSKETSISFLLMIAITLVISGSKGKQTFSTTVRIILPIILVTVFYLLVRFITAEAQPGLGAGRYGFRLGVNIILNTVQLLFASSTPISSVSAFVALKTFSISGLLTIIGATGLFLLVVFYGLWVGNKNRRVVLILCAFALIALFPVVFLNHVSELYAYNSMPFIAMLVGVGLATCLETVRKLRFGQISAYLLIVILFVSHIAAIQSKAIQMKETGDRTGIIASQIVSFVGKVPLNGRLLLLNPPDNKVEYSIYRINGFNVLLAGLNRIYQLSGRQDFKTEIVSAIDAGDEREMLQGRCVVLTLYDNTTHIYEYPKKNY
jgi:hypothetical protein